MKSKRVKHANTSQSQCVIHTCPHTHDHNDNVNEQATWVGKYLAIVVTFIYLLIINDWQAIHSNRSKQMFHIGYLFSLFLTRSDYICDPTLYNVKAHVFCAGSLPLIFQCVGCLSDHVTMLLLKLHGSYEKYYNKK